jgi:hypothetical protein
MPDFTYAEIVSTMALILAAVALLMNFRLQSRQIAQIDEEQANKTKADVRVSLEAHGQGHRFFIRNVGTGVARNIEFEIVDDASGGSPLVPSDYDQKIPVEVLRNGDSVNLFARITINRPTSFECEWRWTNEDGQREERSQTVTL